MVVVLDSIAAARPALSGAVVLHAPVVPTVPSLWT
jgi:hypothetical protein